MLWYYRPYSNLLPLFERFATIFDEEIKWFSNEQPKFHYMTFMLINRYLWLFWKHIIHFTMIRYYTILHRPKKIKKIWLLMGRLNVFFIVACQNDCIHSWIWFIEFCEKIMKNALEWQQIFGRTRTFLNETSFERGIFWTRNISNEESFQRIIFWTRKLLNLKYFEQEIF